MIYGLIIPPFEAIRITRTIDIHDRLPRGSDDQAIAQLAARHQVITHPLSRYCIEPAEQRALLLGYASVPIPAIREGARRLATAFAQANRLTTDMHGECS